MIDLHCHSHYSDGVLSPEELVEKALAQNLRCLALTDHDTFEGYEALRAAALGTSLAVVSGIELSTRWKKYDIHILGYQFLSRGELQALIQKQNDSRVSRAQQIGLELQAVGIENAYEKACFVAGHKRVGRPHFARVLVDEGKAQDVQAAFKRYLGRGRSAYVPTQWVSMQAAVHSIAEAGGQAVIAHPLKYGLTRSKLHELIEAFKEAGGVGVEVVSGEMTVTQVREVAATSLRFDLLASSGSDYHGGALSCMPLGRQRQLPDYCTPIWQQWNRE